MPAEENKAVARRFIDALNQGDLPTALGMLAPNYLDTDAPAGIPRGPEGWQQTHRVFFDAFPDLQITIADQIAEGDRVMSHWTARGTHTGELLGLPPTGKAVTVTGVSVGRIADGLFVENLDVVDRLGMLQQVGAIPTPEQTKA
jgi:steroid delta-isomerase-like uncharacterized protein